MITYTPPCTIPRRAPQFAAPARNGGGGRVIQQIAQRFRSLRRAQQTVGRGAPPVGIATCFYLLDFSEKKLRCGHARRGGGRDKRRLEGGRAVRVFAPALGGAAYTCKDLRGGGREKRRLEGGRAAESLAGKDRYEFENSSSREAHGATGQFFDRRTVLTLSDWSLRQALGAVSTASKPRACRGAMGAIHWPLHRLVRA